MHTESDTFSFKVGIDPFHCYLVALVVQNSELFRAFWREQSPVQQLPYWILVPRQTNVWNLCVMMFLWEKPFYVFRWIGGDFHAK